MFKETWFLYFTKRILISWNVIISFVVPLQRKVGIQRNACSSRWELCFMHANIVLNLFLKLLSTMDIVPTVGKIENKVIYWHQINIDIKRRTKTQNTLLKKTLCWWRSVVLFYKFASIFTIAKNVGTNTFNIVVNILRCVCC